MEQTPKHIKAYSLIYKAASLILNDLHMPGFIRNWKWRQLTAQLNQNDWSEQIIKTETNLETATEF